MADPRWAQLAAAAREATPGPWHYADPFTDGCVRPVPYTADSGGTEPPGFFAADTTELTGMFHTPARRLFDAAWHNDSTAGLYGSEADARYIAAADPTTVLALIEENERLREALRGFAWDDSTDDLGCYCSGSGASRVDHDDDCLDVRELVAGVRP